MGKAAAYSLCNDIIHVHGECGITSKQLWDIRLFKLLIEALKTSDPTFDPE